MYCKICRHNFNSGETFAIIGDAKICANCSFSTTVYDLVTKNIIQSETLDENVVNADFVIISENKPPDENDILLL